MNLHQDTKPEKAFYCADGSILKNLRELAQKLKTISPEAYSHHANSYRNDFYNWIKDVYGNEKLAKEVAFAGSSREASAIIEKAIALPQKKKTARRKKTAAVIKRKPARRRKKPAKQIKKTVAAAVAVKKKEKKKPTGKIKKRRKTKRKPAKRKSSIGRQLKMIAKRWGFM